MKKWLVIMLAAVMAITMCACGGDNEEETSEVANPVHECSKQEMLEVTGMELDAPEGATDVEYGYIETEEEPIAQVEFEINGVDYCYRAQSIGETTIGATLDEAMATGTEISGIYGDLDTAALVDAPLGREGVYAFNEGEEGYMVWLDVVPGVLYSLSVDEDASIAVLMDFAETLFVPMQGDVG